MSFSPITKIELYFDPDVMFVHINSGERGERGFSIHNHTVAGLLMEHVARACLEVWQDEHREELVQPPAKQVPAKAAE